jgi:hypothetical protein
MAPIVSGGKGPLPKSIDIETVCGTKLSLFRASFGSDISCSVLYPMDGQVSAVERVPLAVIQECPRRGRYFALCSVA